MYGFIETGGEMANISRKRLAPLAPIKMTQLCHFQFCKPRGGRIGESRYAICSALLQYKATTQRLFVHCKAVPYCGIQYLLSVSIYLFPAQ